MRPRPMRRRALLTALLGMILSAALAKAQAVELPSVEELLEEAGFSAEDQQRVFAGEIVWRDKAPDSSERELTVQMAFLIRKPTREVVEEDIFGYADLAASPEAMQWSRIEGPGTVEDFAELEFGARRDELARMYLDAQSGNDLNLSEEEIASFRALRSSGKTEGAAVEATLHEILVARFQAYRDRGLAGIAPYQRKKGSFQPSDDIRAAVEAGKLMKKYAPEMYRTQLEYPRYKAPGLDERFAWMHFQLEELPSVALTHQMALEIGDGAFVAASRHFYASRSYNVTQEQGGLFPVGEGSLLMYSNRTSLDRLAGMGSSLRHKIGRKIMSQELAAIIERMLGKASTD